MIALGRDVSEALGVVGPATVQCFRAGPGDLKVTDVNLRFGGAFPLPLAAGSEYPALALALARGDRPEPKVGSQGRCRHDPLLLRDLARVRPGRRPDAVVFLGPRIPAVLFFPGLGCFVLFVFILLRRWRPWPCSCSPRLPATAKATLWLRTRRDRGRRDCRCPAATPPGHRGSGSRRGTGKPVRSARVVARGAVMRATPRGIAALGMPRHQYEVRVSAPGYAKRAVKVDFRSRVDQRVELWRPALQWPMYGANPARTQVQSESRCDRLFERYGSGMSVG